MCNQNEVNIIVQDHIVNQSKECVARMQRRVAEAQTNLYEAQGKLHNDQCKLQYLREQFLKHTI